MTDHPIQPPAEADDAAECPACCGNGWRDEWRAVAGHYEGGEIFRIQCEACNGKGKT